MQPMIIIMCSYFLGSVSVLWTICMEFVIDKCLVLMSTIGVYGTVMCIYILLLFFFFFGGGGAQNFCPSLDMSPRQPANPQRNNLLIRCLICSDLSDFTIKVTWYEDLSIIQIICAQSSTTLYNELIYIIIKENGFPFLWVKLYTLCIWFHFYFL